MGKLSLLFKAHRRIYLIYQIIPESLFCKLLLGTVFIELMIDIIIEVSHLIIVTKR